MLRNFCDLERRTAAKTSIMLFILTTTYQPATDLGYLLHKHPARAQSFEVPFGNAHVFYPEATRARCTAALASDDPTQVYLGLWTMRTLMRTHL